MSVRLTDEDISKLIRESKPVPAALKNPGHIKTGGSLLARDFSVVGSEGCKFRVILRHNPKGLFDFSVILAYLPDEFTQQFRLVRYNGKHRHRNRIEKNRFFDFHIHRATQRYQDSGYKEDAYAEPTTRYSDIHSAIRCLLKDCGFDVSEPECDSLFSEEEL